MMPTRKMIAPSSDLLTVKIDAAMAAFDRAREGRAAMLEAAREREADERMARILTHQAEVGSRIRRWGC